MARPAHCYLLQWICLHNLGPESGANCLHNLDPESGANCGFYDVYTHIFTGVGMIYQSLACISNCGFCDVYIFTGVGSAKPRVMATQNRPRIDLKLLPGTVSAVFGIFGLPLSRHSPSQRQRQEHRICPARRPRLQKKIGNQ